jgi:hypothetical protein
MPPLPGYKSRQVRVLKTAAKIEDTKGVKTAGVVLLAECKVSLKKGGGQQGNVNRGEGANMSEGGLLMGCHHAVFPSLYDAWCRHRSPLPWAMESRS